MTDARKCAYGIGTPYAHGKAYHQPGWKYYAEKAEAERRTQLQNAKIVLREKRMKMGDTRYTFTVKQGKNGKPYLVITRDIAKINYRGSIVIFAPYLPDFLRVLQQLSKGFE
jgi:hypothetical protein